MNQALNRENLWQENLALIGTGGVSERKHTAGFVPAFRDVETGRAEIAGFIRGGYFHTRAQAAEAVLN